MFDRLSEHDTERMREQLIHARRSKRAVNSRFRVGDPVSLNGLEELRLLVWSAEPARTPEGYRLTLVTPDCAYRVEGRRPSEVWQLQHEEPSDTEEGQRAWARVTFGATMLGHAHPDALAWLADYYAGGWVFACGSSVWSMPHGIDEYRKLCTEYGFAVPIDMAGNMLPVLAA